MASLLSAACTCPAVWRGDDERGRPLCRIHEKWLARDKDGTIRDIRRGLAFMTSEQPEQGTWSEDLRYPVGVRPV